MTWLAGKVRNSWLTSSYIITHLPNTYLVMYDESSLLDHATNRDRLLTYNLHLLDYYGVAIHQLRYTLIAKVKMRWAIATRNIIIFTLSQTAVLGHAVKTTPPTYTHTHRQAKQICMHTPLFRTNPLYLSTCTSWEKTIPLSNQLHNVCGGPEKDDKVCSGMWPVHVWKGVLAWRHSGDKLVVIRCRVQTHRLQTDTYAAVSMTLK